MRCMPTATGASPTIRSRRPCRRSEEHPGRIATPTSMRKPWRRTERAITAFLVGLKSRGAALSMQRMVNEYPGEPLTAILPGVDAAGGVGDHRCGGEDAVRRVGAGGRRGPGGHAGGAAHQPERAPPRDGDAALGRRAAGARVRADPRRGGVPHARGHRARRCGACIWRCSPATMAGVAPRIVHRRGLAVGPRARARWLLVGGRRRR